MPAVSGERVVIVSNRLPLTLRRSEEGWRAEASTGGLVTAMRPVLERTGGLWIGWPGDSTGDPGDEERRELLARWERDHAPGRRRDPGRGGPAGSTTATRTRPCGRSSTSSPPASGSTPRAGTPTRRPTSASATRCSSACGPATSSGSTTTTSCSCPSSCGRRLPTSTIGFFLHIPFPSPNLFRVLPRREELLRGLLGADLIAFQTHGHLAALSRLGAPRARASTAAWTACPGRRPRRAHRGAAHRHRAQEFTGLLERKPRCGSRPRDLGSGSRARRILLAVDRLDYTKGIPERLRAFRRLLRKSPALRGEGRPDPDRPALAGADRGLPRAAPGGERARRGDQRASSAPPTGRRSCFIRRGGCRGRSSSPSTLPRTSAGCPRCATA